MRLTSLLAFLAALATLAVAAYAAAPYWQIGLAASGVISPGFVLAVIAALVQTAQPDRETIGWAAEALLAELVALGLSRHAPLGLLPPRPLLHLVEAGLSLGGLGLCLGGVALAMVALRGRGATPAVLSGLALLGALVALGPWLARLS